MTDKFITELNTTTTLSDTDLLISETNPSGTPETKGITWSNTKALLDSRLGWVEVSDSWSYASATTITVPSDATTKYKKGWGIRLKQGGSYKYFYIIGVAATTLTVTGGSDYSVANAAITDIAYAPNPSGAFGFPGYFNYTPSFTAGITVGSGTATGQFKILNDNIVKEKGKFVLGSGSAVTGNVNVTSALTIQAIYETSANLGLCTCVDTGSAVSYGPSLYAGTTSINLRPFNSAGTYLGTSLMSATVPHTWASTDELGWDITYFLA